MKTTILGSTGLRVSRLNFGTGSAGWAGRSKQSDLGIDELSRLLRLAHDLGVNFWDTADQYGTHPHIRAALKGLDRSSVVINSKTTARGADAGADAERFLREMGTDYLDICMLHGMSERDWPRTHAAAMEALSDCKRRGLVRAVGVSVHTLSALGAAGEHPWVDVILTRLTPAERGTEVAPDRVVPQVARANAAGKGVYVMKVLGVGKYADDVPGAFRTVLASPWLHAMTVGMASEAEIRENVRLATELEPAVPAGSSGNGL